MGLLTFKGGIHPNDGKSLAKDKAIVEVLPEGDLVFPLSQHIGAPAAPIVKVGDQVLKGQKNCGGRRVCLCSGVFLGFRKGKSDCSVFYTDRGKGFIHYRGE